MTDARHLEDDSSLVGERHRSYGQRHGQDPQHHGSRSGRGQAGVCGSSHDTVTSQTRRHLLVKRKLQLHNSEILLVFLWSW